MKGRTVKTAGTKFSPAAETNRSLVKWTGISFEKKVIKITPQSFVLQFSLALAAPSNLVEEGSGSLCPDSSISAPEMAVNHS